MTRSTVAAVAAVAGWFASLVLVLVVGTLTGLDGRADHLLTTGVYILAYASVIVATLVAARGQHRRHIPFTAFLVVAWVLYVAGDAVSAWRDPAQQGPGRLVGTGDWLTVAAYAVAIVALGRQTSRSRTRLTTDQVIDGCIVGVGLATIAWVGFLAPGLRDPGFGDSPVSAIVAASFPALDLVLLAFMMTYLTGPRPIMWSTVAGLFCPTFLFLGDCVEFVNLLEDRQVPLVAHVCWVLALGAGAVSVLLAPWQPLSDHGSGGRLLRRGWVPLVYSLGLMPLGIYTWELLGRRDRGQLPDGTALSVAVLLIFALVVARAAGMMRTADEQSGDLEVLARSDHLTGLPNRRTSDAELSRALLRVQRTGEPLSVTILDLDHFKDFNDAYGHHAGDELLSGCAHRWSELLGPAEVLSRYGGEEFVLITVGLPTSAVIDLVDRLRVATPRGQTFSAGIALWRRDEGPGEVLARADEALYAAKANGRARSYLWELDGGEDASGHGWGADDPAPVTRPAPPGGGHA